jgi:mRNA interferase MazF
VAAGRGEVWLTELDPVRGHEQAGRRPCVVLSVDAFNRGPAGLLIVAPLTTTARRVAAHVEVDPPEGGLDRPSFIMCEAVRSISTERLMRRLGAINTSTIEVVEHRLRVLLGL